MSVSRRDVLKSLSMSAAASSVLRVIPLQAAEYAHHMITTEKATSKTGAYTPKFFPPQQYKTLQALCESIFPADADSGGAVEAGAPEFIDLLTSENPHYQLTLGGGMMWLDSTCTDKYGKAYLECTAAAEDGDAGLHCLPQECGGGCERGPGCGVFCLSAQPDCGWVFHQQDWDSVFGLYRERVPGGVSWLPAGSRSLKVNRGNYLLTLSFVIPSAAEDSALAFPPGRSAPCLRRRSRGTTWA